jgi:hypothetical protein
MQHSQIISTPTLEVVHCVTTELASQATLAGIPHCRIVFLSIECIFEIISFNPFRFLLLIELSSK